MKLIKVFSLVLLFCFNCNSDDNNDISCTLEFIYGLNITLIDADTTQVITSNVELIITEGSYQETLMNLDGSEYFIGAGERAGTYILNITAINYEDYTSEPIVISEDICHVIPQVLAITLQPL